MSLDRAPASVEAERHRGTMRHRRFESRPAVRFSGVTPDEAWLTEAWRFVRAQIPAALPQRVLDIGCGPLGGFVPMLRREGHDAVGVDPRASDGPHYPRTVFERFDPPQEFDVVVASTSCTMWQTWTRSWTRSRLCSRLVV